MITRRAFLTLAGMVAGATAVHLLPLVRGVRALPISPETAVPTTIPMQVGAAKPPYQVFIPTITGGGDGH